MLARLVAALDWHGALSMDLIVADSGPVIIDVNPRLVEPANALAVGVDLVAAMLDVAGDARPAQPAGTVQPGHRRLPTFPFVRWRRIRAGAFIRLKRLVGELKIRNHEMSANHGDLVDRMSKKHSVSPAAV
jgi:biotin carboxylase